MKIDNVAVLEQAGWDIEKSSAWSQLFDNRKLKFTTRRKNAHF